MEKKTKARGPAGKNGAKAPRAAAVPDGSTVTVSQDTLEATPNRLLDLLKGIGTRPAIRGALARLGYTAEEHKRGWDLLYKCSGFVVTNVDVEVDRDVVKAISELDQQDERIALIIEVSLKHRAPAVLALLLDGLTPGTGAESVVFFSTLLPRLEALARGKLGKLPADQQKIAHEALEQRSLDADARAHFQALVDTAQGANGNPKPPTTHDRKQLDAALREARAFYEEWSALARSEVKRRDHLISLGLATRRTRANGGPEVEAPEAPPPAAPEEEPEPA